MCQEAWSSSDLACVRCKSTQMEYVTAVFFVRDVIAINADGALDVDYAADEDGNCFPFVRCKHCKEVVQFQGKRRVTLVTGIEHDDEEE